jgi:predicted DNA binding CopG/RHH family protein
MRKMKLTKWEKETEDALLRGEYVSVPKEEFEAIKRSLEARRKDAVLNIRINKMDLDNLKQKAKHLGIKYQTFIAEMLHKIAVS